MEGEKRVLMFRPPPRLPKRPRSDARRRRSVQPLRHLGRGARCLDALRWLHAYTVDNCLKKACSFFRNNALADNNLRLIHPTIWGEFDES